LDGARFGSLLGSLAGGLVVGSFVGAAVGFDDAVLGIPMSMVRTLDLVLRECSSPVPFAPSMRFITCFGVVCSCSA
jgi:hypothetical protein